eukprot:CAMPEP_0168169488 /NCGR_PEP_ID=MMETSP0139_2-20121125/3667_1 /TAXON_ID=44445 /ORGANISM="Pseudo-nitzschia australis, Strain 10249 10 AB" /LENGTH=532 /DNA_ID=CAMNT_0008086915 /DNA_START=155 /DNA_END=1750 /DNA_ORIENTATION=-
MNDVSINLLLGEESASDNAENRDGRFFDSNTNTWANVVIPDEKKEEPETKKRMKNPLSSFRKRKPLSSTNKTPKPPVLDGDGKILVTIPSFRDGQQCGYALVELFKNAKEPDNVVVSLVEQQHEDDPYCLEVYCKSVVPGIEVLKRKKTELEALNILSNDAEKARCPRINQIRVVNVQDTFAKGPPWSRALGRRSLGNEEFCLQTAAHSSFVENWDEKVRKEWLSTNNEFGIISNPPKPRGDDAMMNTNPREVPRTCSVEFLEEEGVPRYDPHPDGKVDNLEKPLLAHAWSPGFSFSKCHIEEAAPADGLLPYVSSDIEGFARYARFWTRGYDVYTPTQNIVYRQPGGPSMHGLEWIIKWAGRKSIVRNKSLKRIRSYLEILEKADENESPSSSAEKLDNLGIYGIGKRRTLKQLDEFVGIDLTKRQSRSMDASCGNFQWVPYNWESISPMDNLYSNPNDLDPQPEYPLRTNLTFEEKHYEQRSVLMDLFFSDENPLAPLKLLRKKSSSPSQPGDLPYGTLLILWALGLVLW